MAAIEICSTPFVALGRAQASALGYSSLPIAVVPHPFGTAARNEVRQMAKQCADDIAGLACGSGAAGGRAEAAPAKTTTTGRAQLIEIAHEPDLITSLNRLYRERRWGDGLPVIPPTRGRVEQMLAHTPRAPHEVVARLAPAFGAATVECIAINAVLAGCEPEYLPVLIAAVEAAAAPEFNLQGIQSTTNPVAVWIIVNGPVAKRLGINGRYNCLGEGEWANATIGRALRLVLRNAGGALPGGMDRATQGQPGKYTFCCAENEDENPWEPLHVERGYAPDRSTVTVVGAEGTMNMCTLAKDAGDLLRAIAGTMNHPPSNEYVHGGEPWLVLAPEHARILHDAGLTKTDVKRRLWEQSKMRAGCMAAEDFGRTQASRTGELGMIGPDTLLTISHRPEEISIIVAGGPGTHSVYIPCFGNTRSVTREVVCHTT
ncbi:MAG: hypothetical protein HY323_15850 [Betaproteobacteria bacterium]|nr:hypothetical protein [Betaproteobacteria bacterium]